MLESLLDSDVRWMLSVTFPSLSWRLRSHSSVSCLSPYVDLLCFLQNLTLGIIGWVGKEDGG